MLFSIQYAFAYDIEISKLRYNLDVVNQTVSFCGVSDEYKSKYLTIPSSVEYNGKQLPVISISSHSFVSRYYKILDVVIPNSVIEIEPYAFGYACGVENITIEDGDNPIKMGRACDPVTTETGTKPGEGTFGYCSLNEVYIGRNLDYTESPFAGNAIKKVSFGEKVTIIQDGLFQSCLYLTDVIFSNSIVEIGSSSFSRSPITNSFIAPQKLKNLGFAAFAYSSPESIDLNCDNLTEIPVKAFAGINEYSTTAGKENTKEIILGKSIVNIREKAFYLQKGIKKIICYNSTPPLFDFTDLTLFVPSNVYADAILYVPSEAIELYKSANIWKYFWEIKPIGTTGIESNEDIDYNEYIETVFNIDGSIATQKKGIKIVKYKNGNSRKLIK